MNTFIKNKLFPAPENFGYIADQILNHTELEIYGSLYRIKELEFYLYNDEHKDKYVHCHLDQNQYGKWYFHKRGKSYKSGTYKGLDLTLGHDDTFCGVLIRGIEGIDGSFIDGPCCTVNHILEMYEYDTIDEFTEGELLDVIDNEQYLVIRDSDEFPISDVYCGKRVGLSDKYPEFKDKPYRYAILTKPIKKDVRSLHKT